MKWFRENRFLGAFLIVVGACTLGAVWFLRSAKEEWDDATIRFNETATELHRLERLAPYPSRENLSKMKAHTDDYAVALANLKDELKARVLPVQAMAPNEFQSQLRLAIASVADKARANKVRLPDKFCLGFDEFSSALPSEATAPLLGQELVQVEWLLGTLFDAHVDALTFFRRTPLPEEHGTAAPGGPKLLERNVIEATFVSSPAAARKVLNQIAGASEQFFIVRLLHVRNEKDKGPLREVAADASGAASQALSPASTGSPNAGSSATTTLNFIVGNERIETTAKIEIVRFMF